jgi:hypothetical protein
MIRLVGFRVMAFLLSRCHYDQLTISIDLDMPRRVISLPPQENKAPRLTLAHLLENVAF